MERAPKSTSSLYEEDTKFVMHATEASVSRTTRAVHNGWMTDAFGPDRLLINIGEDT